MRSVALKTPVMTSSSTTAIEVKFKVAIFLNASMLNVELDTDTTGLMISSAVVSALNPYKIKLKFQIKSYLPKTVVSFANQLMISHCVKM